MKNLRKILAVVLVICMAFSLMAVASAKQVTDYSDASTVKYTEAVDLMTGLGIMTGTGGTSFDPTVTFTREMAAKVICYILLGNTVSSSLTTSTSSFKDVAATRWSAPYIEYCASSNIINGVGDGNFAPAAPITGTTMAKLLITALGYGAKGEFTGANWEINTLVKAQTLGILDTGVNYAAAATREQVAKYVFNVLTKASCFTVTYNAVLGNYAGNYDTSISAEPALTNAKTAAGLGALTFGLAKTARNMYGLSQHQWTTAGATVNVSGVYSDDNVIYTGTNGKSISALTTVGDPSYKASLAAAYTVYENGNLTGTNAIPGTADTSALKVGTIVKFMDNVGFDGIVDKVVIVEKTVVQLSAAPVVNADTTITIGNVGTAAASRISYPAGLAKNDYVLVYTAGGTLNGVGTMTYVEKSTSITGTVNGITGSTYTIGTTNYKLVGLTVAGGVGTPVLGNSTSTYYTDNMGNIVKVTNPAPAAPDTYGLVLAYQYGQANLILGTSDTSKVQLLLADGTKKIFDLATGTNGAVVDNSQAGNGGVAPGKLMKYLANGSTISQISVPLATTLTAATTVTTAAAMTSINNTAYYTTANTVFFFYTSPTVNGVVKGSLNVPTTTSAIADTLYFDASTSNVLNAVVLPESIGPVAGAPNYAYITSAPYSATLELVNGVSTVVRTYNVIKDGTAATLKTLSTANTPAGLYTVVLNSNGFYSFTAVTYAQSNQTVTVVDPGFIVCNGQVYLLKSTTQMYQATFIAGEVSALTVATPTVPLTGTLHAYVVSDGLTPASATIVYFWYE